MKFKVFFETGDVMAGLPAACRAEAERQFKHLSKKKRKEHLDSGEAWIVQRAIQLDSQIREVMDKFVLERSGIFVVFDWITAELQRKPVSQAEPEDVCPVCKGQKEILINPHQMDYGPCPHCQD